MGSRFSTFCSKVVNCPALRAHARSPCVLAPPLPHTPRPHAFVRRIVPTSTLPCSFTATSSRPRRVGFLCSWGLKTPPWAASPIGNAMVAWWKRSRRPRPEAPEALSPCRAPEHLYCMPCFGMYVVTCATHSSSVVLVDVLSAFRTYKRPVGADADRIYEKTRGFTN